MALIISDEIITAISEKLEAVGFTVMRDYIGDINEDSQAGDYPAFIRVKGACLSEFNFYYYLGETERRCLKEITLVIRALGSGAGFSGAETLSEMTEAAAVMIYFNTGCVIKSLSFGEIKKNMALGRLEQVLELTVADTMTYEEPDETSEVSETEET